MSEVDVLIITAADGEDDAVLSVVDGLIEKWTLCTGPGDVPAWRATFATQVGGSPLRVILTSAHKMGGDAAAVTAASFVSRYSPKCLAVCGVCAGNPRRTALGDVIIADHVYRYDAGAEVAEPDGKIRFLGELQAHGISPAWTLWARQYEVNGASWLADRPLTLERQEQWLLLELLDGRDPKQHPERKRLCPLWSEVLAGLWRRGILVRDELALTEAGASDARRLRLLQPDGLPEPAPFRIHVGPLGTGTHLVRDETIWGRLETANRNVRGLEMEAYAIGLTGALCKVPRTLVVKGVMDSAEPGRTQHFRGFAARAAAEVLLGFLRRHIGEAGTPEDRQQRVTAIEAFESGTHFMLWVFSDGTSSEDALRVFMATLGLAWNEVKALHASDLSLLLHRIEIAAEPRGAHVFPWFEIGRNSVFLANMAATGAPSLILDAAMQGFRRILEDAKLPIDERDRVEDLLRSLRTGPIDARVTVLERLRERLREQALGVP